MGNGIAHVFAQHDYAVQLYDISADNLSKALATIDKNLSRLVAKEKIDEAKKAKTLGLITTTIDLSQACAEADLVVEAATENEKIKLQIFRDLDTHCKADAILASNTSSISITKIAAATSRPDKVIGMHFMNPVPIMKLVEVINGYSTSKDTTDKVLSLSSGLGKIPIAVNDYPGFIANRILLPMINEAIYSLYEGVAGVAEIDGIMKLGMGHPMGPFQLADFIGLDVCLSILRVLHSGLGNPKYAPCPLLVNMVTAKKLGRKSKEGFYSYHHGTKELVVSSQFGG